MNEDHKAEVNDSSVEQNLSKDYVPKGKLGNLPVANNINEALKKKMDTAQKEIEKLKGELTKKFKFIEGFGIVPSQASKIIETEYEISETDSKRGLIHLLMLISESQFKNIGKIRLETIDIAKKINEKFWIHIMTPIDIWNLGLDSKFDVMEALSMSFPVIDKGIMSALRVTQIHKSLVLRKFEKYVTSYVISGSLVRGEATKTSDVDVFIVIDDTDVKRMPRLELKEKLRGIIHTYIQEAQGLAGVKNILNVQAYLLTEFWDAVKDAHPVMFTFIRDGVPIYDRGAFLPWKSLLRMGKIKPSPEAIDMFMSSGNKLEENINRRLLDIAVLDIYWGVLTPSQGILMLFGLAPPTPKETIKLIREVFFEKEKILEEKYVTIIEDIVRFYKDYEHGKNKKISGVELDKMVKNALDYMDRLKDLRTQIEKRVSEKSIEEIHENVFKMIGALLNKSGESEIIKAFDEEFIKTGKFSPRYLENLKFITRVKKHASENKKEKADSKDEKGMKQSREVHDAERYASEITNTLVEFSQRKEIAKFNKAKFLIKARYKNAEVLFLKDTFVITNGKIQKIQGSKIIDSKREELEEQITTHQGRETKINFKDLEVLQKMFGEFELVN